MKCMTILPPRLQRCRRDIEDGNTFAFIGRLDAVMLATTFTRENGRKVAGHVDMTTGEQYYPASDVVGDYERDGVVPVVLYQAGQTGTHVYAIAEPPNQEAELLEIASEWVSQMLPPPNIGPHGIEVRRLLDSTCVEVCLTVPNAQDPSGNSVKFKRTHARLKGALMEVMADWQADKQGAQRSPDRRV